MCARRLLLAWTTVLLWLPISARADVASLRFDFEAGRLTVVVDGQVSEFALGLPDDGQPHWGEELVAYRRLLNEMADDELIRDRARRIGAALLVAAAPLLSKHTQWEIRPLEAAPIEALIAPWSEYDAPLLATTTIWYRPFEDPRGPARVEAARTEAGEGLLVLAPFTPGVEPARDDPDPLLSELRAVLKTCDLLPRNDTQIASIGGALSQRRYGLVLLRARPREARALWSVLAGGSPLLWWQRPPLEIESTSVETLDSASASDAARRWSLAGRSMIMDLWPRSSEREAESAAALARALQDEQSPAEALQNARRALLAQPRLPWNEWAGWIYVGDPSARPRLDRPGWLRRLLRRR